MATLTKKDLLEAIEDMPMDAKIMRRIFDFKGDYYDNVVEVICSESNNAILLC